MNAYEQGLAWGSCPEALEARKALGPKALQTNWWKVCERGDWLFWQLGQLSKAEYISIRPVLNRAIAKIIARAIQYDQRQPQGVRTSWAAEWRRWTRRWLKKDGTAVSAWVKTAWAEAAWAEAADAAVYETEAVWVAVSVTAQVALLAAWASADTAKEQRLQAHDIHSEIPEWPGIDQVS